MNLGVWLDTAIGVALFFLAMSFLVSAVVEAISQIMAWRATTLREGIASLLSSVGLDASAKTADARNPANALRALYNHSLIRGLFDQKGEDNPSLPSKLWANLLNGKLPSYVPSATFANAFLDLVTRNGPQQELGDALRVTNEAIRTARDAAPGKAREAAGAALKLAPARLEAALRKAITEVPALFARTRTDAAARLEALTTQRVAAATAQDTGRVALLDGQRHLATKELARLDGEIATAMTEIGAADFLKSCIQQIDALRAAIAAPEAAGWAAKMADVEAAMAAAAPATHRVVNLLSDIASPVDRTIDDAQTLIGRIEHPELRATLQAMLGHSQASVDGLRGAVAKWFDDSMDRVSGWYKRRVQLCGFLVGLVVACAINADAINVFSKIASDEKLRDGLVRLAEKVQSLPEDQRQAVAVESGLQVLPVGWYLATCIDRVTGQACLGKEHGQFATPWRDRTWHATSQQATWADALDLSRHLHWSPLSLLGWIITAFAVKLGAPFWFDLMSSLLKVRSSGVVPAKAPVSDKNAIAVTGGGAAP